jgi:AbrB family looped-hinge helix DNA binding protein
MRGIRFAIDGNAVIRCGYRFGRWRFPAMERARVRVSPKFQIVIPKSIREELHIEPGQDLVMFSTEGTIRILPRRSVKELRGAAKGMRWKEDYRDHSDHL